MLSGKSNFHFSVLPPARGINATHHDREMFFNLHSSCTSKLTTNISIQAQMLPNGLPAGATFDAAYFRKNFPEYVKMMEDAKRSGNTVEHERLLRLLVEKMPKLDKEKGAASGEGDKSL